MGRASQALKSVESEEVKSGLLDDVEQIA